MNLPAIRTVTAFSSTGSGHAGSLGNTPPVDEWLRDIAPSAELRRWFAHEPERWAEFKRRYLDELHNEPAAGALVRLRKAASHRHATLLYGAKDETHNNAAVLQALLDTSHPDLGCRRQVRTDRVEPTKCRPVR